MNCAFTEKETGLYDCSLSEEQLDLFYYKLVHHVILESFLNIMWRS